ncbi:MAG TPA: lipid II flippase MurJ, partial [Myxococcota bacterium]|nr:lipid II flippase MurJ [Myxococcota bacterium]
ADKVRLAPQTLLESTLVVVAFSTWAKLPSTDRKGAVEQGLRQVLLLAPPILAGLAVGSLPLVRLLFERGAFDPAAVGPLAQAVAAFMPGVLGTLVGVLLVKAHVLAGRYELVFLLGLGSSLLNAALNALLGPQFGVVGIAGATSISTTLVALVAWGLWVQREGGGGAWLRPLSAAAVSFLLGALLWRLQPTSIADPRLWLAAVPLLGMLGLGVRWGGRL